MVCESANRRAKIRSRKVYEIRVYRLSSLGFQSTSCQHSNDKIVDDQRGLTGCHSALSSRTNFLHNF